MLRILDCSLCTVLLSVFLNSAFQSWETHPPFQLLLSSMITNQHPCCVLWFHPIYCSRTLRVHWHLMRGLFLYLFRQARQTNALTSNILVYCNKWATDGKQSGKHAWSLFKFIIRIIKFSLSTVRLKALSFDGNQILAKKKENAKTCI